MGVILVQQMFPHHHLLILFSLQGDTSPDDAAQWASYYRSQVRHDFLQVQVFEIILIGCAMGI